MIVGGSGKSEVVVGASGRMEDVPCYGNGKIDSYDVDNSEDVK